MGGSGSSALFLGRLRIRGAAQHPLFNLAQHVPIVSVDALGIARQAAVGALFDASREAADFRLRRPQRQWKVTRQFLARNGKLGTFLQIVAHRAQQRFRLVDQRAGGWVQADHPRA